MTKNELIFSMLTTSTGEAMCDSGGAYGRNWERNIKRKLDDFEKEHKVSFSLTEYRYDGKDDTEKKIGDGFDKSVYHFDKKEGMENNTEYEYSISLFHYLTQDDISLDNMCYEYNSLTCDNWGSDIYGVSTEQKEWLDNNGFTIKDSFNSYNGNSNLTQVIQGTYIEKDDNQYVLLQIHQGCDVRGGYTDAKLLLLENGCMPGENVYGWIKYDNGETVEVSNSYDGYRLRRDDTDDNDEIDTENITSVSLSF